MAAFIDFYGWIVRISFLQKLLQLIGNDVESIIITGLYTLICGGEDFPDMEEFGKGRDEWLKTFLELPNVIPDNDTFRRVFDRINPEALTECLYD